MALYDRIGIGYDTTRRADPQIVHTLIELLGPTGDRRVIDVACGTGNYTAALADRGLSMVGLDVAPTMLDAARSKRPDIEWIHADATAIPLDAGSFGGAVITLAIHHFADDAAVYREVFRVLDRGTLVIFTATREQMRQYWLCEYFPRMMARAIEQMKDFRAVVGGLQRAGFIDLAVRAFEVTPALQDRFIYSGKHAPEIYLDPRIRAGISSFANLAEPAELETGLHRLAADLESGRIDAVRERYAHPGGDYLFIAARKR